MSFITTLFRLSLFSCVAAQTLGATNEKVVSQTPQQPCYSNVIGTIGFPGPIGQTGMPGAPGPAGTAGPTGRTGEPGPVGLRGLPGLMGAKGEKGTPGGQKGESGARGTTGLKGDKGQQGERGVRGAPGLAHTNDIEQMKQLIDNLTTSVQWLREQIVDIKNKTEKSQDDWEVVNDTKLLRLYRKQPSNSRFDTTFSISDYGYNPSKYEFLQVQVNAEAYGDLNSGSEYLQTYFNSNPIGRPWQTGSPGLPFVQMASYPLEKEVKASSFNLAVTLSSGVGSGQIKFTLIKFKVREK